jgi:mannitol-1-/sugar-/sorbitol-6-phosphatase
VASQVNLPFDAVLFDLDGVLVNSQAAIDGVWTAWCRRHGLDSSQVLPNIHGRRSVEIVEHFAPQAARAAEVAWLLQAEIDAAAGLAPYRGAPELLASLPDTSRAVVTSGGRALATARLAAAGIPLPAILVSADDVTAGKPSPEGYLRAAHSLGASPRRCVVIEDAPAGIEAGLAAGATVVAVASTMPAARLTRATCVVASISQISVIQGADGPRLAIAP